ncbi:MAG: class 3 adenylate cyclase/tetratricopeptide (TPR) repeat protein [Parasphingorhabdus sp.]
MICSNCQQDNRPGRKFCSKCGSALNLNCSNCGFINDADDSFCGGCGSSLSGAATVNIGVHPSHASGITPTSHVRETQRRQVTVLFADLSGFTALTESVAQEDLHHIMLRYFTEADRIIIAYGGTIDKHIGDAVMALFGAPVAHENDTERAIRAALDLHQAMEQLSAELELSLKIHIGIASGLVMASDVNSGEHHEYTVLGDSVNLASRLVDNAGPGETLVSDDVRRDAPVIFKLEKMAKLSVKGIAEPIETWKVFGLIEEQERLSYLPFLGRNREIQQFEFLLDTFLESNAGHTLYVRGEPGIGKSRLVREFVERAEAKNISCHSTLLLNFGGGIERDGIASLIGNLLNIGIGDGARQKELAVEGAVAEELLDKEQVLYLKNLLNLPLSAAEKTNLNALDNLKRTSGKQDAVLTLIHRLSLRAPLILIIEDLHWSNTITLNYILRIAELSSKSGLLLLITSRPDAETLQDFWQQLIDRASLTNINLTPLDKDSALEFASHFMELNQSFAAECVERAEGNPLFLEQLLRNAESMGSEQVPGSIRSIVLSRVDHLGQKDRRGLQAASILGQKFSIDDVRFLIEDAEWDCSALESLQLIRRFDEDYLFCHALIWESVYSTLLQDQLKKLHRRAALRLGKKDTILKAEHLQRAKSPNAAAAYLTATQEQINLYRYESAHDLAVQGLGIVRDKGEMHNLHMCLGECLRELGKPEESIQTFWNALAAATTDVARCRTWIGLASGMRLVDDFTQALEILDKAEAAASGDARLLSELSQIHYLRGSIYFPIGNIDGCLTEHEKALACAQKVNDKENEVRALSGLGDAEYSRGYMKKALEYFQRCVLLSEQNGFGRISVSNQYMVAWTQLYMGKIEEPLHTAMQAVEAAKRAGQHRSEMVARVVAARALIENSRYHEAYDQIEHGLAVVETLSAHRFKAFYLIFKARLTDLSTTETSLTKNQLDEAIEACRTEGHEFLGPWLLSTRAVTNDNPEVCRNSLLEGHKILQANCVGHNYFAFYEDAMITSLRLSDLDAAIEYADQLSIYMGEEPLPACENIAALTRAYVNCCKNSNNMEAVDRLNLMLDETKSSGFTHLSKTFRQLMTKTQLGVL